MRQLGLWAIRGYQRFISPTMPASCRFYPSCSQYTYEAIARYGLLRGCVKGGWRVLRCNPWSAGGYDPVDPSDRERHERAVAAVDAQAAITSRPSPPSNP
jgi:hypothetical protein